MEHGSPSLSTPPKLGVGGRIPNSTPLVAIVVMLLGVTAVYWSPTIPDTVLIGSDYIQLHSRRMQYARDAVFGSTGKLPGWYSRELLGTPFWSNIQNFPFIPTRLSVLFTMEPNGSRTYGNAITLSAILAALFTYFYSRKVGLGSVGAAVAGWTFACSGYYASRVAAGHLPLLEGYPALPLVMWTVESLIQALERGELLRRRIAAVVMASTCAMLAGHPQLPVYAMAVGALYSFWRGGLHRALWVWSAMVVGVGAAAFALVPMTLLVGRSTRVLALAPPSNDLPMPYSRLAAFFFPWRDGAPPLLDPDGLSPFASYPSLVYFWDTVSYIGLLPWISIAFLIGYAIYNKPERIAARIGLFITSVGLAGILLSLPFIHQVTALIPGTIFRSPARIIYLTEFALAIALAAGIHSAMKISRQMFHGMVLSLLLLIHVIDLGLHDRRFILRGSLSMPAKETEMIKRILKEAGNGRVAIDYALSLPFDRTTDDVGFFDSIMLSNSYRLILDLAGASPELNIQTFNGSEMSPRGLAALGVKFVVTTAKLDELQKAGQVIGINIYRVPSPAQRAEFFDNSRVQYVSDDQIHAKLRDPKTDLSSVLLLSTESRYNDKVVTSARAAGSPVVEYRRPDSDHIECIVETEHGGYLRIIESWDPGWSAEVDGMSVPIVPALGGLLAVPITPGRHVVKFAYRTPGAGIGIALSLTSLALLCGLIWISGGNQRRRALANVSRPTRFGTLDK
jgi:hypothetical protein